MLEQSNNACPRAGWLSCRHIPRRRVSMTNSDGFSALAPETDHVSRLTDSAVSLRAPTGETPVPDSAMVPMEARGSIRVLVIDDDRILREGCASVLQVE